MILIIIGFKQSFGQNKDLLIFKNPMTNRFAMTEGSCGPGYPLYPRTFPVEVVSQVI